MARQMTEKRRAQVREANRRWKERNPDKAKAARDRANAKRTSADNKRYKLKYTYGITVEDYQRLLQSQEGLCAICRLPPGDEVLHVDHDHVTGKVRGLLHSNCNRGLGLFCDNPEALRRAAEYVEKSKQ